MKKKKDQLASGSLTRRRTNRSPLFECESRCKPEALDRASVYIYLPSDVLGFLCRASRVGKGWKGREDDPELNVGSMHDSGYPRNTTRGAFRPRVSCGRAVRPRRRWCRYRRLNSRLLPEGLASDGKRVAAHPAWGPVVEGQRASGSTRLVRLSVRESCHSRIRKVHARR